jgi:hypothetical protein
MVFSMGFSIVAIGEQPDNLEAIRRTAADQDCRRHVATQIGAGRLAAANAVGTTVLNEDSTWDVHGHLGMFSNGKDPAPFATLGAIHRGVGHGSMAQKRAVQWNTKV